MQKSSSIINQMAIHFTIACNDTAAGSAKMTFQVYRQHSTKSNRNSGTEGDVGLHSTVSTSNYTWHRKKTKFLNFPNCHISIGRTKRQEHIVSVSCSDVTVVSRVLMRGRTHQHNRVSFVCWQTHAISLRECGQQAVGYLVQLELADIAGFGRSTSAVSRKP